MSYCSSCLEYKYKGLTKVGTDCYVCEECRNHAVTEHNKQPYINNVYMLLSHAGFKDIQRDYVEIHVLSPQEFAERFKDYPMARGMHCGGSLVHDDHGRMGFVQEISVVNYLHYIEFQAVLAHELLHAWQLQQNIEDFNHYERNSTRKELAEGFAQLGTYIVYSHYFNKACSVLKGKETSMTIADANFAKALCCNLQKNNYDWDDPAYGIAYKKILDRALHVVGWEGIIREARQDKLIAHVR